MSEQVIIEVINPDVTIFAYPVSKTGWKLRYTFLVEANQATIAEVQQRLIKSFNLTITSPDAYSEAAIIQKAILMRNLLRINFGLEAEVILVSS